MLGSFFLMCSALLGSRSLIHAMSRYTPAMGAATPLAHLPHDAPRHVVAREQLRWTPCGLVALSVSPAFVRVGGRLRPVVLRDVIEHEAAAFAVLQDAALAPDALRDQNAADTRRPDHAGRVELDELHVLQRGASAIGQRVAVARVLPAIARDPVGAADARRWRGPRLWRGRRESAHALGRRQTRLRRGRHP